MIYAAVVDVAARLIYNEVCLALALLGVVAQIAQPAHLTESIVVSGLLFVVLLVFHQKRWIGGGDVKLLVALALGFSAVATLRLLTATALAGGVLALMHLVLRRLPVPARVPAGASLMRRVYAVERWRNVRNAPLPYGAAIACGAIWTLINRGL